MERNPQGTASASISAIEDVLDEARPRLTRAYLAVRGVDGAADAASEAVAWGWEHSDRLATMANPVGYRYRVGLSRTRSRKQPVLPAPEIVGLPDVEPRLIPALLVLPLSQRSAVWLVHACGWTYAEVGEALDISPSTVGTHVSRALASLRRELGGEP